MDLCHCIVPEIKDEKNGQGICVLCGLWFIRKEWEKDPRRMPAKVGRNDPCPCGSGKKFKKCCL